MTEVERYNEAWATGDYAPLKGFVTVRCLYRTHYFNGYKKLLDVGCGPGAAVKYHREIGGIESYGIDFAESAIDTWKKCDVEEYCSVASAEDIPFKSNEFDMVTCTDVLEHIPEDNVKKTFDEMLRVGNKDFFFTIALEKAQHGMPHDGSEPHICIKSAEWWIERMVDSGYWFTAIPYVALNTLCIQARVQNESKH